MGTAGIPAHRLSWWDTCRRHGYFFREAAMLTIATGFSLHLFRVAFGDEMALQYVVTPTVDKALLVPMTYAAVTGILGWRRMRFRNKAHRILITASIAYITASVPLHVYFSVIRGNVDSFVNAFPVWFSYLLLCAVYPAFLVMLARLRYRA
ncbi:MAG: conserved hypothetical rane protein [Mycobacterium sp.]|jgi:hypothetical protein|nr:conserved hypothetical rane protein [Mycobacterium sp.]